MKNSSVLKSSLFTSIDLPSKETWIAWCSVLPSEAVLIITGNLLTIVAFAVNRGLRKKKLFLIINMAFADMLGGLSLPLPLYVGHGFLLWPQSYSTLLIVLQNVLFNGFFLASLISAALISGERFYAIYWPLRRQRLTSRAYCIATLTIWTLAFLASAVFTALLYLTSMNFDRSCFMVVLLVVCGFNIGIWRKFKCRDISSQQLNNAKQIKRLSNALLSVSIVALLSLYPYIMYFYGDDVMLDMSTDFNIYFTVYTLSLANSFLNPVVYSLRIPEFRQALVLPCQKKKLVITKTHAEKRRHDRVDGASLATPCKTLGTNFNRVQQAYEKEVMDTKL